MDLRTVLLFFVGVPVVGVLMIVIAIIGGAWRKKRNPTNASGRDSRRPGEEYGDISSRDDGI